MSSFFSNAKINLGLKVINKREDGYHNLHSLFVEVDLADELVFSPADEFHLLLDGSENIKIPLDETNLINQAYRLIKKKVEAVPIDYAIRLNKQIPIGSGLGGGSSNAATTLTALNDLWELNLTFNELENLGKSLGSDVPFFIRGGLQLIEGVGDIIKPIDPSLIKNLHFILVVPPIHVSTSWAYSKLNKTLQPHISYHKFSPLSKPMKWELFDNDFEQIIYETYPEIGKIKTSLQKAGAMYAGLSGSGSTVFGVFDNLQKAKSTLAQFSQYQTFHTSPVFR